MFLRLCIHWSILTSPFYSGYAVGHVQRLSFSFCCLYTINSAVVWTTMVILVCWIIAFISRLGSCITIFMIKKCSTVSRYAEHYVVKSNAYSWPCSYLNYNKEWQCMYQNDSDIIYLQHEITHQNMITRPLNVIFWIFISAGHRSADISGRQ
jgi:hypothetical protein